MAAYKLSKNGWVMPFFVIFSLAREKLLVTVALDHPVFIVTVKSIIVITMDFFFTPHLNVTFITVFT